MVMDCCKIIAIFLQVISCKTILIPSGCTNTSFARWANQLNFESGSFGQKYSFLIEDVIVNVEGGIG